MTGADARVEALVGAGLVPREARWLVEEFDGPDDDDLWVAARRRLAGEPLQYVIGHWPFRTLDLELDERVLIPRPETEELVGLALETLAGSRAPLIVDLGCGSGAIGLALVRELAERGVTATLIGVDRSVDALCVARANALKHQVRTASFVVSDWFAQIDSSLRSRVDLVVANPPYVAADEFVTLDPVLSHEPYGALVADDADGVPGFAAVAQVIASSAQWLAPGGSLVCEHGAAQGAAAVHAAAEVGFVEVRDVTDLAGWPRVLVGRRP